MCAAGARRDYGAGESFVVPPGTPHAMHAGAVLMQANAREFRLTRPPRWLQVPLLAVLESIGRALGYRAR